MCCQSLPVRETCEASAFLGTALQDCSVPASDMSSPSVCEVVEMVSGEDFQSPLARWYAEPVTFELVGKADDSCCWQAVPLRAPNAELPPVACDQSQPPGPGPGFVMIPVAVDLSAMHAFGHVPPFVSPAACLGMLPTVSAPIPSSSASTSASSPRHSGADASCDIDDSTGGAKLSASAARRRRRQKAAAYAALEQPGQRWADHEAGQRWAGHEGKERVATAPLSKQHCALLSSRLARGSHGVTNVLEEIRGSVRRLSSDVNGCRLVQDVLQAADQLEAATLAAELRGNVWPLIASPHGNYVVQKAIEALPGPLVGFVADELRGYAAETAQHRFGCRVMCRLLEHSGSAPSTVALIDEALTRVDDLCVHAYGHHVIESVLEHGHPAQQSLITRALCSDLMRFASDRNSSFVMKAVLAHCSCEDTQLLIGTLLEDVESLLGLAEDRYGHHIVLALLRLPCAASSAARDELHRASPRLQDSSFGIRILEEVVEQTQGRL